MHRRRQSIIDYIIGVDNMVLWYYNFIKTIADGFKSNWNIPTTTLGADSYVYAYAVCTIVYARNSSKYCIIVNQSFLPFAEFRIRVNKL